jgi:hypothetical protein
MLLAGATVVYAFFTATGSGSGRASTASAQSITVTPVSCSAADLYPGGPAGAICFTLTNPNPYNVSFTGITYLPNNAPIVSNSPTTCAASNFSIATNAPTSLGTPLVVNHGATTSRQSIAGVVLLASSAPDGCQNVTADVPVALSGTQQ